MKEITLYFLGHKKYDIISFIILVFLWKNSKPEI